MMPIGIGVIGNAWWGIVMWSFQEDLEKGDLVGFAERPLVRDGMLINVK